MAQSVLSFQYEEEKGNKGMTALSGLPVYLDLARVIGLSQSIRSSISMCGKVPRVGRMSR